VEVRYRAAATSARFAGNRASRARKYDLCEVAICSGVGGAAAVPWERDSDPDVQTATNSNKQQQAAAKSA
jgi:hypothetical protein